MNKQLDLEEAERRLFSATFKDGLLDIMISAVLLMFSVAPLLSETLGDFWSSAVFVPFWALMFLILFLIRRLVVRPRLGQVKYGPQRITKLARFTLVMLIVNVIFFLAGILATFLVSRGELSQLGWFVSISFGLVMLFFASVTGFFLNLPRLYVYGLFLAIAPVIGEWLYRQYGVAHHGLPIVFGVMTAVIFLVGLVMFIHLMREPFPPDDHALTSEARSE